MVVGLEKTTVHEVVAFDAGKGEGKFVHGVALDLPGILQQVAGGCFPNRPRLGCGQPDSRIRAGQPAVIGADQVTTFDLGNLGQIGFPGIRKNGVATLLVEPLQFPAAQHEDATQDQFAHPLRVCLCVGQGQRGAPGTAEYLPAVDAEVLAQALHVRDQFPGGVLDQFGMRRGAPATALIEQDDVVMGRVKETPGIGATARAGASVQENHGFAIRIAALLVVQPMQGTDLQEPAGEGFNRRIEGSQLRAGHVHTGVFGLPGSSGFRNGRGGGIRTHDPLPPRQVRYQAALRPDETE